MVLESPNGFLGRVVSVQVWGDELPFDVVCSKKLFYDLWALVIQNLYLRLQTSSLEILVDRCHCAKQVVCGPGFEWFGNDGVAVLVVCNHNVLVTSAGFCWESPRLIGEELASNI